jgi:hypothetical protein
MLAGCGASVECGFDMCEGAIVVEHEVHDLFLTADATRVVTKCCHYSLAVNYYYYNLILNESWSTFGVSIEPEFAK